VDILSHWLGDAGNVASGDSAIGSGLIRGLSVWATVTSLLVALLLFTVHKLRVARLEAIRLRLIVRDSRIRAHRLQRAVDGSSDGFWEWSGADVALWCSKRYRELLGYGGARPPAHCPSWVDALHPIDRATTMLVICRQTEAGKSFDAEYRVRTKGTGARWFRARGRVVRDASGNLLRMSGSVRDVTDKKAAEAALLEGQRQLRFRQRMEAIGGLAGGVAHEFNNLLHIIQSYSEFAMSAMPDFSEARSDLEHVLVATKRAAALTRQLLEFSRSGPARLQRVDSYALVNDLTTMLRPMLGDRIALSIELGDGQEIMADRALLQQALWNLCVNAREAMPRGGKLTVRTTLVVAVEQSVAAPLEGREHDRLVEFSVIDTGIGIPPEIQERIFEPFFTTKEVGKNCGLGLAIAYGIVEQHEGTIRFESSLGVGSTFRIRLPVADPSGEFATAVDKESYWGSPNSATGTELMQA
jgi:PAS domain S-box-containing protein